MQGSSTFVRGVFAHLDKGLTKDILVVKVKKVVILKCVELLCGAHPGVNWQRKRLKRTHGTRVGLGVGNLRFDRRRLPSLQLESNPSMIGSIRALIG